MGEIAHVDLDRLRAMADTFWTTSAEVAAMRWPAPPSEGLPGSDVGAVAAADLLAGQVSGLVEALSGWAMAARTAAEAFAHTDVGNGERFAIR